MAKSAKRRKATAKQFLKWKKELTKLQSTQKISFNLFSKDHPFECGNPNCMTCVGLKSLQRKQDRLKIKKETKQETEEF